MTFLGPIPHSEADGALLECGVAARAYEKMEAVGKVTDNPRQGKVMVGKLTGNLRLKQGQS